jgi:VWFA-related protein
MKRSFAALSSILVLLATTLAQNPKQPPQQLQEEDIIRISTQLVQTNVVVVDKNEQIVPDLKLEDFELYDNGRKQDLKFMEFVSMDTGRRTEGTAPETANRTTPRIETESSGIAAKDLKRVIAFVIDDLTIPDADVATVRDMLLDFVNNKMRDGDLVAIVRTVGGKGLLQQFTGDRQLLRRSIAQLNVITHPFKSDNRDPGGFTSVPVASVAEGASGGEGIDLSETGTEDISGPEDDVNRLFRGLSALTTANFLIDSLRTIPGYKNLFIISGGIPIFEAGTSGTSYSNVSYLLNRLADNAIRAGVAVNTLDPRGLKATPGVVGFNETPASSGLASEDPTFGRGGAQNQMVFGNPLAGGAEHLGLSTVAETTGGVSIINTNNFKGALDKVLARSRGYYTLAYTPSERFDNKFHKIEVKLKRTGLKTYTQTGYVAREEANRNAPVTKEEQIAAAVRSPLVRRDIEVTPTVMLKMLPAKTSVDIYMLIDAQKLHFTQNAEGKYETTFDVVGFVFDQLGKLRGGFSDSVKSNLTPDNYQRALKEGLTYQATTELPPGYFQVRAVVREESSGSVGTFSKYLEIPDLKNGRLAMGSVFIIAMDDAAKNIGTPMLAARRLTRKQDLRYAVMIHNAKLKDGKPQLVTQAIISQAGNIVYQEPETPLEVSNPAQVVKIGQLGLSKVKPGKYFLTVNVTDLNGDKKYGKVSRTVDFTITQ